MMRTRAARTALAAGFAVVTLAAGWSARAAASARTRAAGAAEALLAESPVLLAVSPDGRRLLLRVAETGGFRLRVATRGGEILHEVHWVEKPVLATWRPDRGAVAFLADSEGDQEYRPFLWELVSGRARALSAPATRVPQALVWSPDGARLAHVAPHPYGPRTLYVVDARGGDPALEVIRDVAARTGVAWSPDGARLAAARSRPRGEVSVAEPGGRAARAFFARGAEVRELAWRPDGRALLAVLRSPGEEFFRVSEADLATGSLRGVATPPWDASAPAYLPDGRVVHHQNRDGEREPVACAADGARCRALGGASSSTDLLGLSPGGDSAYLVLRGRGGPPVMAVRPLTGSLPPLGVSAPAGSAAEAERVLVRGRDGLGLPAYVWRGRREPGRAPAMVVRIHGGPAVQSTRSWDASVQYLVNAGIDVMLLNYRGSTGYGARFEDAPGGTAARVEDVLAARDYAVRGMGIPAHRVFLYGHSYGALLAARAMARDSTLGGAVLVSLVWGDGDSAPPVAGPGRVLLFHGENDPLPPRDARGAARAMVGARDLDVRVFAREGHAFQRVETWAEVYAAVARLAAAP